nr:putative reverse transcriptase domain-containing protein [Tanacetum cinerariifolium]
MFKRLARNEYYCFLDGFSAVMSSASFAVTYTSVYTDSEPGRVFWGADEELSDRALEDEHILSAEEQPLPLVVSPTAKSSGYVAESNPKEDQEEYKDDETEDGQVDYPMDGGDDGDDDDGGSSRDDADNEDEDEEDEGQEEEEEDHLAPVDSAIVIPTDELVSPPEGAEPIIPPPSTDTATTGARITVRLRAAISLPPAAEVERLLAMPTPSPSLLASLLPPSAGERLARCTAPAALPSPPLHMPPPVDRRDDILETEMPPRKRLCLFTLGSKYEVTESSTASPTRGQGIDYGFVSTLDAEARRRWIGEVGYETLRVMGDMRQEMGDMQAELLALHEQPRRAGQPGGGARVPNHQDAPRRIMAPVTRQGPSTLPNNTDPNNMTPEFVQAMIDQALLRNSTNRDGSHSSPEDNRRNVQTARPCFYADFMKCQPLNFKGTEGVRKNGANLKGNGCFECGASGYFKRDCPKLKNKDGEKVNAPGWVYAVGNAKKRWNASRDPNSNVVTGTFLLNNRNVSILFDTGADRSFISTAFSSLIDIVPTPLGNSYDVELADGRIVEVDTIMRGCTLNFLGHPFNLDLMPVELGSFDVIIGMDWLRRCHAVIVCDGKLVRIPYGNETLTFCGNESNNGRES